MTKYVTIAVPPKGRTSRRLMYELKDHGYLDGDDCEALTWVLEADRRRIDIETHEIESGKREDYSSIQEVIEADLLCPAEMLGDVAERVPGALAKYNGLPGLGRLRQENPLFYSFKAEHNLNRAGKPPRLVLSQHEIEVDGIPVRLVGVEHYDAPWHIASERVDLAVAGFDEIASTFSGKDNTTLIKRWPAFNSAGAYGEPIILGSAGLDDYCAHFIIAKEPELFENIMFREDLFRFYGVDPVLVDQKYVPIYRHFIRARGNGGKAPLPTFMKSDKVEADVEADGKMGIVIVNSGASVGSRDLFVYGMPVIQSETHLIADREVIERDKDARHVADKLVHNQYTDQSRMRSYAEWYSFLRTNITDDRWVKRPAVSSMFLDEFDRRTWSRGASRVRDEDLAALEEFEAQLYQGAR